MSIALYQLRHAMQVAECGSFSEAARRSSVSQSAVSGAVADLESLLGKQLFSRTTRRVEVTAFGRAILPRIAEAIAAADAIAAEARALIDPDRKLLRIAFSPLLDIRRMTALCAAYRTAHPDVEIIFKECAAIDLDERLEKEQIDIACGLSIAARSNRSRCLLFHDPLHYVPRSGHTEGLSANVQLEVIAQETLLLTVGTCGLAPATEALFDETGLRVAIYPGRAMSHATMQEWAELGLGAAILPASRIQGPADRYPKVASGETQLALSHEAVWLTASKASSHLRPFLADLPKVARSINAGWA